MIHCFRVHISCPSSFTWPCGSWDAWHMPIGTCRGGKDLGTSQKAGSSGCPSSCTVGRSPGVHGICHPGGHLPDT